MTEARDLAGAARHLLRLMDDPNAKPAKDAQPALTRLENAIAAWDLAGHPEDTPENEQRAAYVTAGRQFANATGVITLGAYEDDALATEGLQIRMALQKHMKRCAAIWYGPDDSEEYLGG